MQLCIAGGDIRMLAAAELFEGCGYKCAAIGFDDLKYGGKVQIKTDLAPAISKAAAVIMPFPCLKNGFLNTPCSGRRIEMESILCFDDGKRLFIGGNLPPKKQNYIDYSTCEDFLRYNAVPTAEGAVAIAMQELNTTLHGAEITVVGYGRIGSYLAHILHCLGARVTVVARNPQSRASAEIMGANAVGFENIEAPLSCADAVFNTVPCKVIGPAELGFLRRGTAIIDLASLPGGADEAECARQSVKLIRALGLPGKVAPAYAGKALFRTVLPILINRGITP